MSSCIKPECANMPSQERKPIKSLRYEDRLEIAS
jgi:hypothetical protein